MTRSVFLPFALPDVDQNEYELIRQTLNSGWITTGPLTRRFESEFAAFVGAKHAIAVNSCTAAMHLALEAIGLQRGDEVITTPYTFAATAEVVRYFDAKPVLVDICAEDFNIDPERIEAAITPRTKAIIPVHIAGLAARLDEITEIAARYQLAIIEDAAHAFPTQYKGRMIGQALPGIQHAVCFSFYATKTITTGEGGMIVTDNDQIAERCRIMALHGISRDAWKRYTAEGSWYYEIIAPGYKYNMTDIAAAMGLAQLAKAERMASRRRIIAQMYNDAFSDLPELQTPLDPDFHCPEIGPQQPNSQENRQQSHAWHLYMLRLNLERLTIDRGQFIELLKTYNIGASVHFIPLHLHPYYREVYKYQPQDFPIAYQQYLREVSLPIYSKMSDEDVNDVIAAVCAVVAEHRR
ncbi:MAG: spore coat protein [Patescibacteria group bacterium]|uniref:DegT/DnrJ/EryC1/StrS family aminotransferase n=1 Tax=Caldilinea sp. TaxID=2293560 RepID=UPI0021DCBD4A|nr:DegT/DnrJ/EryC1/StrS family aminotransferase [Caldilinea sp.]GIV70495.1 MAG: spore coat protein [Caldilinea sp.]GIW61002.1 MAG: spore coat protein [Patescibacteria group bacterium]